MEFFQFSLRYCARLFWPGRLYSYNARTWIRLLWDHHVKRMEAPAKDLSLAEKIRECQVECRSTYGYRRVHIWLERHGIHGLNNIYFSIFNYSLSTVCFQSSFSFVFEVQRQALRSAGILLDHFPSGIITGQTKGKNADFPHHCWIFAYLSMWASKENLWEYLFF